jgi:hypothetical protein
MSNQPITIFWKNFRGETVYTESRTLAEVLTLLEEDDRAIYNRYGLPTNEIVDDMQLRDWYVAQMQNMGTSAAA